MSNQVKLVDRAEFIAAAKDGAADGMALHKAFTAQLKAIDSGARTIEFIISTATVDRMQDTIAVAGWKFDNFLKSPVVLWAHDSSQPPIAKALSVTKTDSLLLSTAEFMSRDLSPFADSIFRMYEQRFLSAVSVGFIPIRYEFSEDDRRRGGVDFTETELIEFSCCPVPANPEALMRAKAAGIDLVPLVSWAERLLDGEGKTTIPRTELNRLRKAAKEPPMTRPTTGARRADDDKPEDPKPEDDKPEDKATGNCGRDPDEKCGMTDPSECSVHSGKAAGGDDDDTDEKRLRRILLRLLKPRRRAGDDDPDDDEPPVAHEDAIRLAHKCLRTSKAFMTEAVSHHQKAMGLLDGVVGALDDKAEDEPDEGDGGEPAEDDKNKQLLRAAELRRKYPSAA